MGKKLRSSGEEALYGDKGNGRLVERIMSGEGSLGLWVGKRGIEEEVDFKWNAWS